MTPWRPWTIVLRGQHSRRDLPITFLRFFTRRGAEKWLREWEAGRKPVWMSTSSANDTHERLLEAYVARVDEVETYGVERE